jgi:hypothetical protein
MVCAIAADANGTTSITVAAAVIKCFMFSPPLLLMTEFLGVIPDYWLRRGFDVRFDIDVRRQAAGRYHGILPMGRSFRQHIKS